jgi:hypothetical protein
MDNYVASRFNVSNDNRYILVTVASRISVQIGANLNTAICNLAV